MTDLEARVKELEAKLNEVYQQRNYVVALLSRLAAAAGWKVGVGPHEGKEGENWDDAWRKVVFVETPEGQLAWHLHRDEERFFAALPEHAKKWDGHTTEQKHARIERVITKIDSINAQLYG